MSDFIEEPLAMRDTVKAEEPKPQLDPVDIAAFNEFKNRQAAGHPDVPARRRWFVAGNTFIFPGTAEGDIRITLSFKFKLLREIFASGLSEPEQLVALLDGVGDTATIAQLDELEAFDEIPQIVDGFFTCLQEKNEAAVGEASRSSN